MGLKIKCPLCKFECDTDAFHVKAYHDLLFKIHEKIDVYQNTKYPSEDTEDIARILKSLLESEK